MILFHSFDLFTQSVAYQALNILVSSRYHDRYYLSTQTFKPDVRHLYWANIDGENVTFSGDADKCITCNLYEDCLFNDVKFSATNRYYIFGCLGPGVPKLQLRSIDEVAYVQQQPSLSVPSTVSFEHGNQFQSNVQSPSNIFLPTTLAPTNTNNNGLLSSTPPPPPPIELQPTDKTLVWNIEENIELQEKIKLKAMPQLKRLFVPVGPNGQYNASVLMLLPPKIKDDDEQNTQYPMVVNVYAGPGSQHVDQRFDLGYGYYLASNKNIIYTMIDARGSGYQGSNMLFELYQRFGSVEIEDQISVTRCV